FWFRHWLKPLHLQINVPPLVCCCMFIRLIQFMDFKAISLLSSGQLHWFLTS
ncbi:unnamed protein product, partial [Brassica rapa subsp. narinosa]